LDAVIDTPRGSVFVSYSRGDIELIRPIIQSIRGMGSPVFDYQDVRVAEVSWPDGIQAKISESDSIVFLISENFLSSANCLTELDLARTARESPRFLLYTPEPVDVPSGLAQTPRATTQTQLMHLLFDDT
jgi:hypothetical protein